MKGDLEIISKIIGELLEQDKGIITYIYTNKNELIYSILTGWDETKAYYLFGVGSAVNKDLGKELLDYGQSLSILQIIKILKFLILKE